MKNWKHIAAVVYALTIAISLIVNADAAPTSEPCEGEWNEVLRQAGYLQSAQVAYQSAHSDWMACEYSGGNCTTEWNAVVQAQTDLQSAEQAYQSAHSDWMSCEQGGA